MQVITSVSRGGLYDGVSRLEDSGSLSILHHPEADPVFDTAASIEELTLGHYKHTTSFRNLNNPEMSLT